MNNESTPVPGTLVSGTITLAVDASACSPLTLELAIELAAACKAQLQGLFIEDTDLLSTAGLPFACEITLTTGQSRGLSSQQLQSSYHRLAEQFRLLLEQKAKQSVLAYSFQSVRGRKQDVLLQRQADAGYLIVDRAAGRIYWKKAVSSRLKRLLLLPGEDPARLVSVINLLVKKFSQAYLELLFIKTGKVAELPGELPANCSSRWVDSNQVEMLLWGGRTPLDFVLVDSRAQEEWVKKLVLEADCPVIVVQ